MVMKKRASNISLQRNQLDERLNRLRKTLPEEPRTGWIRAIKTALNMSAVQLAKRLGISRQAIASYEKDEEAGSITLSTLRKVAAALNCKVVVTFVPQRPLNKLVEDQAMKVAEDIVSTVDLHMKMEKQGTTLRFRKKQIRQLADELVRNADKRLWDRIP